MADGHSEADALKLIERAKLEAGSTGVSTPIKSPRLKSKTIVADGQVVQEFLDVTYIPQQGWTPTFGSVYEGFIAWLEPSLRALWSRKRFSQALPLQHQSIPGPANVRVIRDLKRRP
jgi:hypothetical protein